MKTPALFHLISLCFSVLLLSACSSASSYHDSAYSSAQSYGVEEANLEAYDIDTAAALTPTRDIIKTADIALEAEKPDDSYTALKAELLTHGGYIDSAKQHSDGRISATLKIPAVSFDGFLSTLSEHGKILSKQVKTEDVTLQLVDIDARLRQLRLLINKFQSYLKEAKSIEDVMLLEKKISQLQTQIDRIHVQQQTLQTQARVSTITVNISRKRIYGPVSYIGIGIGWVFKKLFIIE